MSGKTAAPVLASRACIAIIHDDPFSGPALQAGQQAKSYARHAGKLFLLSPKTGPQSTTYSSSQHKQEDFSNLR
ncbi:hypothetical protein KTQ42_21935 [Noviherbaspirillum sp. L7-7A]|uniref:hypothetical protein n=1 Tax=Noviherbaspirillum sp. L7-7A TaxID=2850560 RepID=UPI001C2C73ED|nr:hypothetical protein [Noviherbaspirillum sp. L7-7A]MBV0881941.1 hypothetical protein [Noviherbaspirillum sp. L7-7A]